MGRMTRLIPVALLAALLATAGYAQTPQPFPRAGTTPQPARPTMPAPPAPGPAAPASQPVDPNMPTAVTLGVAIYPTAQFLGSYDAGRGQRYYMFGTTAAFTEVIGYYRIQT